jgi:hypothetical protein
MGMSVIHFRLAVGFCLISAGNRENASVVPQNDSIDNQLFDGFAGWGTVRFRCTCCPVLAKGG